MLTSPRSLLVPLMLLGLTAGTLGASAAPAAADPPSEYAMTVSAPELAVGVDGAIAIKLDVKGGYHWNDAYPATFEVIGAPPDLGLPKATLKQLDGDFKAETPTAVTIQVPARPKAPTSAALTVNAHFSVCNQRICLTKTSVAIVTVVAK